MQDGGGLPSESQWWKYLYSTVVLFFCLIICVIGGGMFARTSALILLVSIGEIHLHYSVSPDESLPVLYFILGIYFHPH